MSLLRNFFSLFGTFPAILSRLTLQLVGILLRGNTASAGGGLASYEVLNLDGGHGLANFHCLCAGRRAL